MKTIDGRATATVGAGVDDTFALLAAVDAYPSWNGALVPAVEVRERDEDGRPTVVRMQLHVSQSPIGKDFAFTARVQAQSPRSVQLVSVEDPTERDRIALTWSLAEAQPQGTRVDLRFHCETPRLPGFFPVFGLGDQIAAYLIAGVDGALPGD
ncbi:MAG TPA: SRPBCC family protein [Solirubrobacteraceae bacterium]|jgi:ribosome-associated toxin RatA of RatAB toxin-antitoxin module|nr:SRPBCC family protein [Solirubrobacteraceae bacterium]